MVDPILDLAHDHRELSGLLIAVNEALSRVERAQSTLDDELHEIRDGIEGFHEALLEHFAREQEGLLPFLLARAPAHHERVDQLIAEHDRIAAAITKLLKDLVRLSAGELASFRTSLGQFEDLYASHTKTELAFLGEVAASLASDPAATEELRVLLAEG